MFRRIVSNLAFSPALVGQLGFYARRLRKEETTRRVGLIFTALALVVQSLAVFSPPEAANAASDADYIPGGVSSVQDIVSNYDRNTNNIKQILTSIGITRDELRDVKQRQVYEKGHYNWSRTSLYSYAEGQRSWNYGGGTTYYRPMTLSEGGPQHTVYAGWSKTFGWFAIKKDCGNLVTSKPPQAPKPKAVCVDLTARKLTANKVRISARSATEDGATIKGYVFNIIRSGNAAVKKIDSNKTNVDFEYTDDTPGTYRVSVTVRSSEGDVTSQDCRTTFDINTDATCEMLTITPVGTNQYRITGKASTKGGVEIRKYVYTITNADGKVVATKSFQSDKKQHEFVYTQATPGKYRVSLTVYTSIGEQKSSDCRGSFKIQGVGPTVACTNLQAIVSNRTTVSLTGSASVSGGATVNGYTFTVRDAAGKVIKRENVRTSQLSATAASFEVSPGDYTADLVLSTSQGTVTNTDNCVAKFTVVKKEVCPYNPSLPPSSPDCQPCPDNPNIWIKDEECTATVISTKTGVNLTQGNVDVTSKTARAGDKISYTLTAENKGYGGEMVTISENLKDVLEYSTLVDQGGGQFDQTTKILSWPAVTLAAGQKQSRTIVVQLMSQIPATNTGTSDGASYDCKMVNTFGNNISVNVECPPTKEVVEQVVNELPTTGPKENMIFAGLLLSVVVYFYARSKQLGKEVRLIRRDLNAGTI